MGRNRHAGRTLLAVCGAATLAMTMTACGGDDDEAPSAAQGTTAAAGASGDTGVAAAEAKLEGHTEATEIGPTKPIGKAIPKGKTILFVNCGQPACVNTAKAVKEGAGTLGWKVDEIAAQPTPESIQGSFDEALRRKPDGIVSMGFGSALYPKQLADAEKAKIPVMSVAGTEESGEKGITFEPHGPEGSGAATRLLADKTAADLDGSGQVGVIQLTGYPVIESYTAAYVDELEQACPECSVKKLSVQPTSLGKDAAPKIANFLRANPDTKALFFSYDLLSAGLPAAAKAAGVTVPKTYSYAPDAPGIQALNAGERTAAFLFPYNESGYQVVDAFARLFTGGDVADSQEGPNETLVGQEYDNVPETGDPFPAVVADYQAQYAKLWGTE